MKPRVFVSSTCYDLGPARTELRTFVEQLGYTALLSEQTTFPVDPTLGSIENCRSQVEREADILVLIVGLRYGSLVPASGKSITNVEYLAARAKRIPIYAFLDRRLESLLQRWSDNPYEDFTSDGVDNHDLFRFVRDVRTTDGVWTHWFDTAADITDTLRSQLAHLMAQGLDWWRRIQLGPLEASLATVTGASLRLALERPKAWEYLLFTQVLQDEVTKAQYLLVEHHEKLALELGEDVADISLWLTNRTNELERLIHGADHLLNSFAQRAVGPPGKPGNVNDLIYVGRAIGQVYSSVLLWSRRVRTANLPKQFRPLQEVMSRYTDEAIAEIESYGRRCHAAIADALTKPKGDSPVQLDLTLTLRMSAVLVRETEAVLQRLLASQPS